VTAPTRPSATSSLAFHPHRIVIAAGALLALGSMSLPYVTAGGARRGALALDALPALLLLAPIVAMTMVPDHSRAIPRASGFASAGLTALAIPYAVVTVLDAFVLAESLGGSVGAGPWLLLVGCVIVAAGVALGLLKPEATHVRPASPRSRREPASRRPAAPPRPGSRTRTTRRAPSRLGENPFGEPLFDSLEVATPAPPRVAPPAPSPPVDDEHRTAPRSDGGAPPPPTLVIDAQVAVNRTADDSDSLGA
jgi:hypothetical protein